MTTALRLLAFSALLSIVPAIQAQTVPAGQAAPAAPPQAAMHAKIKKLLQVTGASSIGLQMIDALIHNFQEGLPGVPPDFWTAFRAKIKGDDLVELIIPVYEKHLTEEDVDGLIAFFSSPTGRRFVEKQPLILTDTMKLGEAWGAKLAEEVTTELRAKGYEPKNE
jgi:hypothetical protein